MSSKDGEIWEAYKSRVAPVAKKKPVAAAKKITAEEKRKAAVIVAPRVVLPAAVLTQDVFQPLEHRREKALRRGEMEIEAKLDLHGMTQDEAFDALADFIRKKAKAGKRCLLIITGKGRGGTGVLRKNLEGWLGQLDEAKMILALRSAAPQHGGDGAFYVMLRKN